MLILACILLVLLQKPGFRTLNVSGSCKFDVKNRVKVGVFLDVKNRVKVGVFLGVKNRVKVGVFLDVKNWV